MFITSERVNLIDYLSMPVPTLMAFVIRPPPLSSVSNIYYLPFTEIVWICSIALFILCTTIIAFTLRADSKVQRENMALRFSDILLFAMASLCQMSSQFKPKLFSARISMVGIIQCDKLRRHDKYIYIFLASFTYCRHSSLDYYCSFTYLIRQISLHYCNQRQNPFEPSVTY